MTPAATRRVALLRGINLGRAKRVAMSDLRGLFEALGYEDVRTLLNSGNVVFTAGGRTAAAHGATIEEALLAKLKVSSRVTVLNAAEVATAVRGNPLERVATDPSRLLVAFLRRPADRARLAPLTRQDWSPEVLAVGARVAYLWCPGGFAAGQLPGAVAKALGDGVTMRNWATVTRLHALLDERT